jgi:hypothetical protein
VVAEHCFQVAANVAQALRIGIHMAIKPMITKRKTRSKKVRDLAARKDPKGGAQKKEGPDILMNKTSGTLAAGRGRMS